MDNILIEVHKYDKEKILQEYKLDLWCLVYLLIKKWDLDYSESVFSLKRKYELEYHNKEIKKQADSELRLKESIEKKLKSLWYLSQNGNVISFTDRWANLLKEVDIKINWWRWKNLEMSYPLIRDVLIAIIWAVVWSFVTFLLG